MKVETPKNWENEELVKTTTAYGNEVMIPKRYTKAWETERFCFEEAKKNGIDLSIGVEDSETSMSFTQAKKNALMVFCEKFGI